MASSQPVMVTEFGFPDRNSGTFNGNLVAAAGARGWGWAAFSWGSATTGQWGLISIAGQTFEPAPQASRSSTV